MRVVYFAVLSVVLGAFGINWIAAQAGHSASMSDLAQQGKALVIETRVRLPGNVGDDLNCSSCHLDAGARPQALGWIGIADKFPEYNARRGSTITLPQRINDCFERSMNGRALEENSLPMRSIVAYIQSLSVQQGSVSRGVGIIDRTLQANSVRGKQIYVARCASCHGADGSGGDSAAADGRGSAVADSIPALWGAASFNDGAGMARSVTAAAFVKFNMPLGQANTLTDQEALDVAEFFTHQSRPVFARKSGDWPHGGKPSDARS